MTTPSPSLFLCLGVDPSMRAPGFAVLANQRAVLDARQPDSSKFESDAQAYEIFTQTLSLLRRWPIALVAIERQTTWAGGSADAVERLANARGAVLAAIGGFHTEQTERRIEIMEIPLTRIRSIIGVNQLRGPGDIKQKVAYCLDLRGIKASDEYDGMNDAVAAAFAGTFIMQEHALVRAHQPQPRRRKTGRKS